MPNVIITGDWGGQIRQAARLFANTAYFRTWTGTATEATALARIHFFRDLEASMTRPLIALYWGGDSESTSVSIGTGPEYHPWPAGKIIARFEANANIATHPNDPENQTILFVNDVQGRVTSDNVASYDGVITQAKALITLGAVPYLQVKTWTPMANPSPIRKSDGKNVEVFVWEWGLDVGQ